MSNQTTTKSDFAANAKISLLKTCKVKDGKRYYNLYLRVNDGNPIAIRLAFEDKDWRKKNLLLAVATPCEIRTTAVVRENPELGTEEF